MHSQGNFGPPTGQGTYSNTPTFHQHPPAPSLPPFSQGSQPPRSTMVQPGPQSVPPQIGLLGQPSYQHTPPGPHQPGPPLPVPSSGVNTRPYLAAAPPPPPPQTQPPQMHGSSQMPQHSQWVQNFIPPMVSLMAPRIPPPLSQGQTLYGSQVDRPPLRGIQSHPPPQQSASSFFTSHSAEAIGNSVTQLSNKPATVSLPPPPALPASFPGAPPLPPSSSPPTSSFPFSNSHIPRPNPTVSDCAFHPQDGSGIDRSAGSADEASACCLVGDDASKPDGSGNCDGEISSKMCSSGMENLVLDLPPPPPKPVDDRTIRNIEVLCQYIAKNGPEFEDMIRQKEFGNPQFRFLFGDEPGSEGAIAYKYFIWMKNKYQLTLKSGKLGISASALRPLGDSSSKLKITTNPTVPSSPADSDMDMEDDITHPDEELLVDPPSYLSHETLSASNDLDVKDEIQFSRRQEHGLGKDAGNGNSVHSEALELDKPRQGSETSSDENQSIMRKSAAKVDQSVMSYSKNVESPLDGKVENSFSLHELLNQQNATTHMVESSSGKCPNQLVKGASPFSLLQDYATEGSSDDEIHVEDVVPSTLTPSMEVNSATHDTYTQDNFRTDLRPKNLSVSNKEYEQLPESFKSEDFIVEADMTSVMGKSENVVDNINSKKGLVKDGVCYQALLRENDSIDANIDTSDDKKDTTSMSTKLKVDEFGRLIKEGASDSDSDVSPHYTSRRGKRHRSRSRSRSPHSRRRRRSPWGRKEKRGRSRSFSPKRRRSRSKSPLYWDGEYPSDKIRRDKGRFPECFDFRRGKCYRGASCRYVHHEDKDDRSRSHRSKQSLQDFPRSSRRSDFYEKSESSPHKKLSGQHDEGRILGLKPPEHMPIIEQNKMPSEPIAHTSDKGGPFEPRILQNPIVDHVNLHSNAARVMPISVGNLEPEQSRGQFKEQVLQNLAQQHENMDRSSVSESLPIQTSASIPSQIPGTVVSQESIRPAADDISHSPPSSSLSKEMSALYAQQVPSASRSASAENYPAFQASTSYPHSQFPVPANPTRGSLPPPPAIPHIPRPFSVSDRIGTSTHGQYSGGPVHLQPNMLTSRNQFLAQTSSGPYISEFPTVSRVGQNQMHSLMQDPVQPSHLSDDLKPSAFPPSQKIGQLHGGSSALVGEDHLNVHNGNISSTMSRYTSDLLDRNQPSQFADFAGSRISSHYSPYASTFEQPLNSNVSSNISIQVKDRPYGSNLGSAYSSTDVPSNGRAVSLGSRNMISPQNTVQGAEGILPRHIGDQYDPLHDSIEPASNSVGKPGRNFEATDESDTMIRQSGSNKPLDVEENNKQEGGGTIAVTTSLENEEYGETADAEVGAVEDGSQSNPDDAEDAAAGEVEIDQVKALGKSRKNKDSRSMKLFKVALANFVKEVLKPSWRQGNMSKEAFKTIVKKTVDKVSGAMKSHQIPRSQTKINHYIDSSQRKLTKLVMGYVDKYVKV